MKSSLSPVTIRFLPHQTKWLHKEAAEDGGSIALTLRRLVNKAMIDGDELAGFCESCNKPIACDERHFSDSEGILECAKCFKK